MKCSVENCKNNAHSRGWCHKHYWRWSKYGDPRAIVRSMAPFGAPAEFLEKALSYKGMECLRWPFATNGTAGYGLISGKNGKRFLAHRIVCERIHGAPPSGKPFAVHSCGNGHLGCICPNHLRWASAAENAADMIIHGRSTRGYGKLEKCSVKLIFKRAKSGENQKRLAAEFGVTQTAISRIKLGKIYGWITKGP